MHDRLVTGGLLVCANLQLADVAGPRALENDLDARCC